MLRRCNLALLGLAILATAGSDARAQYYYPYGSGYGGYGFGGFGGGGFGGGGGGTPNAQILRGYGAFAEGEGIYQD